MTEPSKTPRTLAVMEEMLKEVEPVRYNAVKCVDVITRRLGDLAVALECELAAAQEKLSEVSSKWIPCAERMPRPGQRVFTKMETTPPCDYGVDQYEPVLYTEGWVHQGGMHRVTHWMPLEPPK